MTTKPKCQITLFRFMRQAVDRLLQLNHTGTAHNYRATLTSIMRFRANEDIPLTDVRSVLCLQKWRKPSNATTVDYPLDGIINTNRDLISMPVEAGIELKKFFRNFSSKNRLYSFFLLILRIDNFTIYHGQN